MNSQWESLKESLKKAEPRTVLPCNRTRNKGHALKYKRQHSNIKKKKKFNETMVKHWNRQSREVVYVPKLSWVIFCCLTDLYSLFLCPDTQQAAPDIFKSVFPSIMFFPFWKSLSGLNSYHSLLKLLKATELMHSLLITNVLKK